MTKIITASDELFKATDEVIHLDGTVTSGKKATTTLNIECKAPFYPYNEKDNFIVKLKKGDNEIDFETEDHYNSFVYAVVGNIMDTTITIRDIDDDRNTDKE